MALGDYMNVQCHACIGGTNVGEDIRKLDYGQHASPAQVAAELKVSPSAVEKYVTNIFLKLDLPPTGTDHRRVLAVLKYLGTS